MEFISVEILHIIQCTNLGGMEQSGLLLSRGLKARGHLVRWVSLNPLGALGPALEREGIGCESLGYGGCYGWARFPAMARALRRSPADAVIMRGPNLAAMVALGPRRAQPRLLAVHHYHTGVKPIWQWRLIYRIALDRFDMITFPSDFIRREAEAIYPPVASVSRTVRNPFVVGPLPSPDERRAARERLGLPLRCFIVANAGWLITAKRFDIFLRVAARIAASVPEDRFLIAGDGPERQGLEKLAQRLGVAARINWLGWRSDLTDFYLSTNVLLFNSDWEALGRTPIEAAAHGVPVVASVLNGGLAEILTPGRCALICDSHDVNWLTARVLDFVAAAPLAQDVVQNARSRISQVCSLDTHVSEILLLLTFGRAATVH